MAQPAQVGERYETSPRAVVIQFLFLRVAKLLLNIRGNIYTTSIFFYDNSTRSATYETSISAGNIRRA